MKRQSAHIGPLIGATLAIAALLAGCANSPSAVKDGTDAAPPQANVPTESPTPTPIPEDAPVSGILYLQTTKDNSGGFTISGIDPRTGTTTVERTFSPTSSTATPVISRWTPVFTRMSFDPDFRRVAATETIPSDNSTHVGWLTESGDFVDVTAAVSGASSAFSGRIEDGLPTFGPDGAFYFVDNVSGNVIKVTSATPSSMSGTVVKSGATDSAFLWVWPDNNVVYAGAGSIAHVENKKPGLYGQGSVEDWLSDTTMLSTYPGLTTIMRSDANSDPSNDCLVSGSCTNNVDLVPNREGRLSWNPVASPDGTQVAFLSVQETGDDGVKLFTVPASGGEPQLIPGTSAFERPGTSFGQPSAQDQLIAWR